jgi:hypothetical protein
MPQMDLRTWKTTPDGIAQIESEKHFCIGGMIWQGYRGVPIAPEERLVSTRELEEAADIDGSKAAIWKSRRQRIEARYLRKMAEYDERRAQLRRTRSEIRQSIREDKDLGLEASEDDLDQIKRIEQRMRRLVDLNKELDLEAACEAEREAGPALEEEGGSETPKEEAAPQQVTCGHCEKISPPGHKNPQGWLKGHEMGAHRNPMKKAGAVA